MDNIYSELNRISVSGEEAAICTVVNTKGSVPRKTGAKMIVLAGGKTSGTIGGGALEKGVIENALSVIRTYEPKLFRYDLMNQFNMCCGGSMDIYIEPVMKKNKLYIFGSGHVGRALGQLANMMQFEVYMIDDRKVELDQINNPEINKMHLHYSNALPLLPFDSHTYICIMTYSHPYDRDILAFCMKKPYAYLGMIGSLRKVEITKKRFREAMIASDEELQKVDMPMGLDINAESPEEIAISIMGKIIKTKNEKSLIKHTE